MSVLSDVKIRISGLARTEKERYSGGADLLQFGYSWLQEHEQS